MKIQNFFKKRFRIGKKSIPLWAIIGLAVVILSSGSFITVLYLRINEDPQTSIFVNQDFTELDKIYKISKYTSEVDDPSINSSESNYMKHYYFPFLKYRYNYKIKIFSPVKGVITNVNNKSYGLNKGLMNKRLTIRSDLHKNYHFIISSIDLISENITIGLKVEEGELIGYAHIYYPKLNIYAHSFNIGVFIKRPFTEIEYISYFNTTSDDLLQNYRDRNAPSREELVLPKGETHSESGDWMVLNNPLNILLVPRFVYKDYADLEKVYRISRFRSGVGHDFSDPSESNRSMKHYYVPYDEFRDNNLIKVYSPVNGTIIKVGKERHGTSEGLINRHILIKSNQFPEIVFITFHTDLLSEEYVEGKKVEEGEHIGYFRMYYPDLDEYGYSFDIGVYSYIKPQIEYISYFQTMRDALFQNYIQRGVNSRSDLIITEKERNNDPLKCDENGIFINSGNIDNWVELNDID